MNCLDEPCNPLKILEIRPGNVGPRPRSNAGDRHQPVLILHQRKRPEQNPFDPTEDRSGRADSQRQAEDGEYRKARTAPQHPDPEEEISEHIGIVDGSEVSWLALVFVKEEP
jgi:hypothetical protein